MASTATEPTDRVDVPNLFSDNNSNMLVASQPVNGLTTNISLPLEIIHSVFGHLLPHPLFIQSTFAREYEGEPDVVLMDPLQYFRRSLLTYMLVDRSWALLACSLLYQRLVFAAPGQIARFSTSLSFSSTSLAHSPLRSVREIHILTPLTSEVLEHLGHIVRCIEEATQTSVIRTLRYIGWTFSNVQYIDLSSIVEAMSLKEAKFLSNVSFANSLQFLWIWDVILEESNLPLTFPCLEEIVIQMHGGPRYNPSFRKGWEGFPSGGWSLPALKSIIIRINELARTFPGLPKDVTFLQFLRKHGHEVEHFMLDGLAKRSALPSSTIPASYLQPCLDLLPKLRHLVLTQAPWKSYRDPQNSAMQLSHPKLRWIDYGVVPCAENMLGVDRAAFVSHGHLDEVPRIRGGARTKATPRIAPEFIEEERVPGPIPPEWGAQLPSLRRLRKIDF
ncbi:hypothetical protein DL96DRAFT_1812280, partial [Flagelloscypha sp. PMI_526]